MTTDVSSLRQGWRPAGRSGRHQRLPHQVRRPRGSLSIGLVELWRYRRVVRYFGWHYVVRKFQGMWLGLLWIPLRPTLDLLSRALVFGAFLQVGSGDRPYLIFLTVGMSAWMLFERTAYWGYRGLRLHRRVLDKTQIPWLTAIVAAPIPAAVDATLYASVGIVVAIYYKVTTGTSYIVIGWTTGAAAILGIALVVLCGITFSLWNAPLVLKIQDLRLIFRYVIAFWLFLTPVLYTPSKLPAQYRLLFDVNPLTAPVELVKYGLLGTGVPSVRSLVATAVALGVALPLGLVYLRRNEHIAHARL